VKPSPWLEKIRRQESTIKKTSGAFSDINGTFRIALERFEALKLLSFREFYNIFLCSRQDYMYMHNVEEY